VRVAPAARLRARSGAASGYARARLPGRRTHWRQTSWCALDLELTGLDPRSDEIISFGAIPIEDGRLQLRGAVHQLVRPAGEISEASIRVHGIRAADLVDAPSLEAAIGTLLETITGRILVVHTAAVERAFLGRALRKQGVHLRGPLIDTEVLGLLWCFERERRLRRGLALADLAALLGLPAERPHDALADALTTAQVFIALATHLEGPVPETVGSMAHTSSRLESMRILRWG
jgi:DNA polymerase III subunit epsilon